MPAPSVYTHAEEEKERGETIQNRTAVSILNNIIVVSH
jgi:hypothetical protein